jgi:uncharacterized protein DUF955
MSEETFRWQSWRERIAAAALSEGRTVENVVRLLAEEIAAACPPGAAPERRWAATGVVVRFARMRGGGRCDPSDAVPVLQVNEADNRYARQFTIAHEIGHLVLAALPAAMTDDLSHRREERLCDEFAHRVIVPADELAEELAGDLPEPVEVLRLCRLFEANPSTMLQALQRQLHLEDTAYLYAKWRGHHRRPEEVDFRIEAVAGPSSLYWPQDKRIDGLGLRELAQGAAESTDGGLFKGIDEEVNVPMRKVDPGTRHNAMSGPVYWRAVKPHRGKKFLLAQIDCSNLRPCRLEPLLSRRDRVAAGQA